MGEYLYGCQIKDHPRQIVVHGMFDMPEIRCSICGAVMHRIPQFPHMNLSGLRELNPNIKRFIEDAPARRDKYEEEHNA